MSARPHLLRTYRSDRHRALDQVAPPEAQNVRISARSTRKPWAMPAGPRERTCCDGLCTQGRDCPRRPAPLPRLQTSVRWRFAAAFVASAVVFVLARCSA